jgi:hypothetical protein
MALTQNPDLYTLSLGHMADLTLSALAFLKLPLGLAAFAFGSGAVALWASRENPERAAIVLAATMVLFFQASRLALVSFDSYLSSYRLASALQRSPAGQLIEADAYYAFSSVFFYTNRSALLVNGRRDNLEYGSYAPYTADVFTDDVEFASRWKTPSRFYLLTYGDDLHHYRQLVGQDNLHIVTESGGNFLLTNHPLP